MITNFLGPKFITFEGGEGSGKSTQSKMLYDYLLANGYKVLLTREVGGTKEAEKIRDILVNSSLQVTTELLLVMAARCEHLHNVIIPHLKQGYIVICDRFIDSTACYQGVMAPPSAPSLPLGVFDQRLAIEQKIDTEHKLSLLEIYSLYERILPIPIMPDITFFIDLPPEIALIRAKNRGDNNKFEEKDMQFHQEVYDKFCLIAQLFPERIVRVQVRDLSTTEINRNITKLLSKPYSDFDT